MTSNSLSSETFSIGEVAIYWKPESRNHGKEVTILSALKIILLTDSHTGSKSEALAYNVDVPSDWYAGPFYKPEKGWSVRPQFLRKKRPPRDDLKLVRWSECPWQPESLHV